MRQGISGRSIAHRGGEAALLVTLGAVTAAGAAWGRLPIRSDTRRPRMPSLAGGRGFRVERTVAVMRRPDELYARWRDLEHLPELMPHLDSVTRLGNGRSRWAARGPVSYRWPLSRGPEPYQMFRDKTDDCTKVVLDPSR